jgi:hypothetical protein
VVYTALAVIGLILLLAAPARRRARASRSVRGGRGRAVAQQYPFRARLVLYVAPGLVLAIAQAAEGIRRVASRLQPALGAVCMAAMFAGPAWSLVRFPPPYFVEDHKTVLAYVRDHRQPGDAVYVYAYEIEAIERYGAEYGLAPGDYEARPLAPRSIAGWLFAKSIAIAADPACLGHRRGRSAIPSRRARPWSNTCRRSASPRLDRD